MVPSGPNPTHVTITGLVQDDRFLHHVTGDGHPERPQRLAAIADGLRDRGLDDACLPLEVTPVDVSFVRSVHDETYLHRLREACRSGLPYIDVPDSAIGAESYEVAQLAAGAVIRAVDDVMTGRIRNAFCAVRPPGHHAERTMSMGFCLLNNVAIAAKYLLDHRGLSRVLIVDFDVHHGNGTQHAFEADPRVLFISIHGHPGLVYPGTGHAHERGVGPGEGFTINVPMLPPSGDAEYRSAFDELILPPAEAFNPQFVIVSAGFDAHRLDPLAPIELPTESFGWMTDELLRIAKNHSGGRFVSVLEGGYHLQALADSAALHVTRLCQA